MVGHTHENAVTTNCFGVLPIFVFLVPKVMTTTLTTGNRFSVSGASTTFTMVMGSILPTNMGNVMAVKFVYTLITSLTTFFGSYTALFARSFCGPVFGGGDRTACIVMKHVTAMIMIVLNVT